MTMPEFTPECGVRAGVSGAGPEELPVAVSETVCGVLGALSRNDSVPVRAPLAVGVKVTLTVQVLPAMS